MSSQIASHRLVSIDLLRGVAALLMLQQHILYWLCAESSSNMIVLGLGAMGGLAAPLFITLAGVGSSLGAERHLPLARTMSVRGATILAFGFLLNYLASHWFSMGAWYVLHLIGVAILLSPLLQKLSSPLLLTLAATVIIVTVALQTVLGTPLRLFNHQMGHPINIIHFFRHMLVEGFFPIFPWIAYFITGIVSGRWILQQKEMKIAQLAVLLLGISLLLALCFFAHLPFTRQAHLLRFFMVTSSFYPSMPPMILLLIALTLFSLYMVISWAPRIPFQRIKYLSYLGQSSMTLLIVHVAVIRESAVYFNFWRTFNLPQALLLVGIFLLLFTLATCVWQKIQFRFGAEWVLRKLSS